MLKFPQNEKKLNALMQLFTADKLLKTVYFHAIKPAGIFAEHIFMMIMMVIRFGRWQILRFYYPSYTYSVATNVQQ